MKLYATIAAGSVLGSLLRWLVGVAAQALLGAAFPWGTLFVNVTGSFVIAFYAVRTGPQGASPARETMRQFVMTGLCGGYTTFSMFSLETLRFLHAGKIAAAAAYIGASLIMWLAAAWASVSPAHRLNRRRSSAALQ